MWAEKLHFPVYKPGNVCYMVFGFERWLFKSRHAYAALLYALAYLGMFLLHLVHLCVVSSSCHSWLHGVLAFNFAVTIPITATTNINDKNDKI
jgi:hypothetical protein